jgi:hypothetical protein
MWFLAAVGVLVALLMVLIFRINHAPHYAPQAYYRHKRTGAPVAYGIDALGPRPRIRPPEAAGDGSDVPPAGTPGSGPVH